MSVEVTLYSKKTTKTSLVKFLLANNFRRADHFIPEMNTGDRIGFMWFGYENLESTTGVEATVYKTLPEERQKHKCGDWILTTRTNASGSYEDKKMQNSIIKLARAKFGGSFYNDWYGTNKYTNLDDYPKYTPLEKALSSITENSLEKVDQIFNCIKDYKNPTTEMFESIPHDFVRDLFKSKDPSILLYNALIPFLVSVNEYFFGEIFMAFLLYNSDARKLIIEEKIKLNISEVLEIQSQNASLERFICDSYNFQNLDSINKAYKRYLSLDIYAILNVRKKINGKMVNVLTEFQNILESRHRLIHRLGINYDLTREEYLTHAKTIMQVVNLIVDRLKLKDLKINHLDY